MQLHIETGSHICELCLINVNESQNGRSSCLDMEMEINNNALPMGSMISFGIFNIQLGSLKYLISGNNRKFVTS